MFFIFEISIIKIILNLLIAIFFINLIKKFILNILFGYFFFFKFFCIIFFFNIVSIIPYRLSITSLTTNLLISFITWLSIFFFFLIINININIRHFLPVRSPTSIIIILVVIETISVLIRPLSLRVRLISNITSRHLIIHLVSEVRILMIFLLILLILFEFFVCFIQSYIFFLLLNIYIEEIIY